MENWDDCCLEMGCMGVRRHQIDTVVVAVAVTAVQQKQKHEKILAAVAAALTELMVVAAVGHM